MFTRLNKKTTVVEKALEARQQRQEEKLKESDTLKRLKCMEIIYKYIEKKRNAKNSRNELVNDTLILIQNYNHSKDTKTDYKDLLKISFIIQSLRSPHPTECIEFLYKEWTHGDYPNGVFPFLQSLNTVYHSKTKSILQSLVQLAIVEILETKECLFLPIRFLIILLDSKNYSRDFQDFVMDLHNVLIAYGFYEIMHDRLKKFVRDMPALPSPGMIRSKINSIFVIGILPLEISTRKDHDVFLTLVYKHFFTVPILVQTFDEQGMKLLKRSKIFEMGVASVIKNDFLKELQGDDYLYILSNMTGYMQRSFIDEPKAQESNASSSTQSLCSQKSAFIPFVQFLLQQCIPYIKNEPTCNTLYHSFFKWYSGRHCQVLGEREHNIILMTISYLWSPSFIDAILNSMEFHLKTKKSKVSSFTKSLQSIPSSNTLYTADENINSSIATNELDLIFTMTRVFVNQSKSIIHAIAFMPKIIVRMWNILHSCFPTPKLFVDYLLLQHEKQEVGFPLGLWNIFCESCVIHFGIIDTSEIYMKQEPFSTMQLYHILKILNRYGIALSQSKGLGASNPHAKKLLALLDSLNSKKPFNSLDPTALDIKINFKNFMQSVMNGQDFARKILYDMPQIVPFDIRVEIFRLFIQADRQSLGPTRHKKPHKIHRNRIITDGMAYLANLTSNKIKHNLKVKFVSTLGYEEAGIDQKGVFREFIEETCKVAFAPELGLFQLTQDGNLFISPSSSLHDNYLEIFFYLGRILGKALYDGLLVDVRLGRFIYSKLLGQYNFLEDLPWLDPELYRNLVFLRHYEGDVSDLGLLFTIDEDYFGEIKSKDIKPNGSQYKVTNETKYEYIYMMADYKLNQQCEKQYLAFVSGFKDIIKPEYLHLFSKAQDLENLMCGETKQIDIMQLKKYTCYEGGYSDKSPTIIKFWKVLEEMDALDQSAFLKFVTSSSKPPLGGFKNLSPHFTIRLSQEDSTHEWARNQTIRSIGIFLGLQKDQERLPSASTCFNLLKLPPFASCQNLKSKLAYSIHSNAGFDLS